MIDEKKFLVAGQCFRVRGAAVLAPGLAPFQYDGPEAPIFDLTVVDALPERSSKRIFTTDSGPGFPEIAIDECPDGYRFSFAPGPGEPLAGVLETDKAFCHCSLKPERQPDAYFALNNALMLLYTFSTAGRGILEVHSSVVMNDGKGYLFQGPSGTGKSTHSKLWLRHIPGTELLNDDNPILRWMPDGSFRVYGSPWSGKTPCYKALDVPVGAIVRIRQAPENHIVRLSPVEAYGSLMASASAFRPFSQLADGWHRTLEAFAGHVPCYVLDCLPDEAAARLCYRTVHG